VKYMLLICVGDDAVAPDDIATTTTAWAKEMDGRGVRLVGSQFQPPSDATTVRVRDDQVLLTDGPFAETKEFIAGFDLLEAADLDEALEVAAKHPVAAYGSVEVRPLHLG
jgi:hypothetical protein